mmetsp:Transcript_27278/g.68884  ORF Transcript_27278/g.68884 Transcript_27278/m.68884 type:complete len:88 (-) Transcript_27278:286-549(-)
MREQEFYELGMAASHGVVERGEAASSLVRVRTPVEQLSADFERVCFGGEMHGKVQRTIPIGIKCVHVGPKLEQKFNGSFGRSPQGPP